MIKRLIGIAVLLVLGFILFVCLSGLGIIIGIMFLTMHPAVIVLGTIVSSCMVLLHLVTKDENS